MPAALVALATCASVFAAFAAMEFTVAEFALGAPEVDGVEDESEVIFSFPE